MKHITTQREQDIADKTGFNFGEKFADADGVRAYFTVQSMRDCFGGLVIEKAEDDIDDDDDDAIQRGAMRVTQDELDGMAEDVIENRWHMVNESAA